MQSNIQNPNCQILYRNVLTKQLRYNLNNIKDVFYKIYFQGTYAFNITLDDDKFIRIFPSGEYLKTIIFFDDVDEKISKTVVYYILNPK